MHTHTHKCFVISLVLSLACVSVCVCMCVCVRVHLQSLHCLRWRLCWHMDFCDFRFPVLSCAYALCVHSRVSFGSCNWCSCAFAHAVYMHTYKNACAHRYANTQITFYCAHLSSIDLFCKFCRPILQVFPQRHTHTTHTHTSIASDSLTKSLPSIDTSFLPVISPPCHLDRASERARERERARAHRENKHRDRHTGTDTQGQTHRDRHTCH
jgi:hypothetical protein